MNSLIRIVVLALFFLPSISFAAKTFSVEDFVTKGGSLTDQGKVIAQALTKELEKNKELKSADPSTAEIKISGRAFEKGSDVMFIVKISGKGKVFGETAKGKSSPPHKKLLKTLADKITKTIQSKL
jgi:hypothetical protein